MQKESVKAFKRDLATYQYKIKKQADLKFKIQECYDRLGGVRAVDPSREPTHSQKNLDVEYAIRDKIEALTAKLDRLCAQTSEIEQILDRIEIPVRWAVFEVYALEKTVRSQADKYFISESGLRKRMNRAIEKALED